jgi:hypothetical protein
MRGVKPRAPPLGWDSQNPEPAISWRRKKESYPLEADDSEFQSAAAPPALRFLRRARRPFQGVEIDGADAEPTPPPKSLHAPPLSRGAPFHERASSAARTRDWYWRRKAGRSVYRLELEEAGVEDLLTAAGLLELVGADDHAAVEAALRKLIAVMIEDDRRA